MSDLAGRPIGPYELLDVERRGRTSTTYRAREAGRLLSVTVFDRVSERATVDALLREARAVAGLRHPNLAAVLDSGELAGQVYVVEEQRPAQTLADLPRAALDPVGAVGVLTPVLAGLGYAHGSGVVHQNVTPRHIAIAPPFRPVLTDFAIGREVLVSRHGSAAGQRMVMGTPAYLAPEQAFGLRADSRSDLYSVGVVLYELLTGHVPFESDDPELVLRAQATQPPPPPRGSRPDLPPSLENVVLRVLAKEPGQRHQSAVELIADLSGALGHEDAAQSPGGLAADYAAGVRAFAERRWEAAVRLLTRVAEADVGYEDVEDLLRAAEDAWGAESGRS